MKYCLGLITLASWLAVPAFARFGEPIDTNRRADLNGKYVDLPLVDTHSLALPVVPQGTAPASRQRRPFDQRVETKRVEVSTLEFEKVETQTRTQPRANFTAKRPVDTSRRVTTGNVATSAADISTTRIDAGSAEGQQELKQRLNRRP